MYMRKKRRRHRRRNVAGDYFSRIHLSRYGDCTGEGLLVVKG
jgi:hypothetical protein